MSSEEEEDDDDDDVVTMYWYLRWRNVVQLYNYIQEIKISCRANGRIFAQYATEKWLIFFIEMQSLRLSGITA
jgi:hypothetical protein